MKMKTESIYFDNGQIRDNLNPVLTGLTVDSTSQEDIIERQSNELIRQRISELKSPHRQIILARFGFDGDVQTQAEIAKRYRLSQQRIQQIEKQTLSALRRWLIQKGISNEN